MTPADLKAWFQAQHPGWNWDNRCAGVAYQVCVATGHAVRPYATATDAYQASVIESRDMLAAPAGAFHFWSYWATIGGVRKDYGHVAVEVGGGWALMSNPEASQDDWGIALGVTNVTTWTARRRGIVTYLGWSRTYGQNTAQITSAAPAGGGSTPIPDPVLPEEEDELMGAREDILAAIDANTARLRLEIRGHIFYDAGPNRDVPFEKTQHAALINGAGRIIVMDTPPTGQETSWRSDRYKYTDTTRTAAQNRVALTTSEFWNKIKDELTARSNDFYTVKDAQAWFAKRQAQIAGR